MVGASEVLTLRRINVGNSSATSGFRLENRSTAKGNPVAELPWQCDETGETDERWLWLLRNTTHSLRALPQKSNATAPCIEAAAFSERSRQAVARTSSQEEFSRDLRPVLVRQMACQIRLGKASVLCYRARQGWYLRAEAAGRFFHPAPRDGATHQIAEVR